MPVGNGAVRKKTGKTLPAVINQGVCAPDVQVGLLLAGK